ncbi:MAG: hypothetical protein BWY67_00582 [Bacteroidetes bacterium ADurb.Bin397]|nr:MAG: hypothetical protein BWY67_00582 [Bacteroidetes bacterium ADurb.Bin397]
MLIAEEVCKHGMSSTGEFASELTKLIADKGIIKVIETGTYLGQGTTKAVLDGMALHKKPFHFISIEVNPSFADQARKNTGKVLGLDIWNGLSIPHSMKPTSLTWDYPDHVIVDHQPNHRNALYIAELNHHVPDDMLKKAVEFMDGRPQLVILDSAGHIGSIEFQYLQSLTKGSYFLALDDTNHVKHYHSMELIRSSPEKFEILFETSDKFGSAIIHVKC